MHLADGVVSLPVLAGGSVLGLLGAAMGLRSIEDDQMPKVAVISAGFFVASLIHVPAGPAQLHLTMNGLAGLILGWAAFPAILVALILQAAIFGYGGFTVLLVNTLVMALPGVLAGSAGKWLLNRKGGNAGMLAGGFLAGTLAVLGSGLLLGATLALSDRRFLGAAWAIVIAHLPVALLEGTVTALAMRSLAQYLPALFQTPSNPKEVSP